MIVWAMGAIPVDEGISGSGAARDQRAIFESHGVVGLGPVLGVAYIVHDHAIAVDVGKGQRRHVGLPVTRVGRRDREPRRDDHDEHPRIPAITQRRGRTRHRAIIALARRRTRARR
jgi:hypothetical protein